MQVNRGHYAVAAFVALIALTAGVVAINVRVGRS